MIYFEDLSDYEKSFFIENRYTNTNTFKTQNRPTITLADVSFAKKPSFELIQCSGLWEEH